LIQYYKKLKPFKILIPKKKFRYIIEGLDINDDMLKYSIEYLKSL